MNLYSRVGLVRLIVETIRASVNNSIALRTAVNAVDGLFVDPNAVKDEYDVIPLREPTQLVIEEALNWAYAYRYAWVHLDVVKQLNDVCSLASHAAEVEYPDATDPDWPYFYIGEDEEIHFELS